MAKPTQLQALRRAVDVLRMVALDTNIGTRVGTEAPFWIENQQSDSEAADVLQSLAETKERSR